MTSLLPVLEWLNKNKEWVGLLVGIVALSYPKLPHPDRYLGTNWYFPYLVLHGVLARVSVLKWDQEGGSFKLPGVMSPSLDEARDTEFLKNLARGNYQYLPSALPKVMHFEVPEFPTRNQDGEVTLALSADESRKLRQKSMP